MPQLPSSAGEHYANQQRIAAATMLAVGAVWGSRPPAGDFDEWFDGNVGKMADLTAAGRARAMAGSHEYVAKSLREQGFKADPDIRIDTRQLAGITSDGRSIDGLLEGALIRTKGELKRAVANGAAGDDPVVLKSAWTSGRTEAQRRVQTQVADAERTATSLEVIARPKVGYVRIVRGGACSRCIILAGRVYPGTETFLRHPLCMCRHVPTMTANSEDLTADPRKIFDALSEAEQNKIFTRAGAEAIRAGADPGQVVNVRRGNSGLQTGAGEITKSDVYGQDLFTSTEGTTKRGFAGKIIRERGRNPKTTPRLMPESIFEIAEGREDALRLLERNGYAFDRTKPGNRGSLLPDATPKPPKVPERPVVDLDALQREREAADALKAAKKAAADLKRYLAAEKKFLAAEKKRKAALVLSDDTRKLVEDAKASLPKGEAGWDATHASYPVDSVGRKVVPAELKEHLDTVLAVGKSMRSDIVRKIAADKDLIALRKEFNNTYLFTTARLDVERKIAEAEAKITQRALAEVRAFGNVEQTVEIIDSNKAFGGGTILSVPVDEAASLARIRTAEKFFPDEWVQAASDRGPLQLGACERQFFLERASGADFIADGTIDHYPKYAGGLGDSRTEVAVHELGHRMEQAISGLTELEFALVRGRSTTVKAATATTEEKVKLEATEKIYPNLPGSEHEVGFSDDWKDKYAGKTYANANASDPASVPMEAFQVGLQDVFGRSVGGTGEFDNTFELQEFVIGVLSLL